jgi:hypothetical protein
VESLNRKLRVQSDEEVRKRSMGDEEARGENPWEMKRSIGEIKR